MLPNVTPASRRGGLGRVLVCWHACSRRGKRGRRRNRSAACAVKCYPDEDLRGILTADIHSKPVTEWVQEDTACIRTVWHA
eukprot:146845-Chlamydomonas_euryale.AAC.4